MNGQLRRYHATSTQSTVGSSNLDPPSLSLNLEANVIIMDRAFNQHLSERLEHLIQNNCKQIRVDDLTDARWWRELRSFFVFHMLSRYPAWAGWLPAHTPRIIAATGRGTDFRETKNAETVGADRVSQAAPRVRH